MSATLKKPRIQRIADDIDQIKWNEFVDFFPRFEIILRSRLRFCPNDIAKAELRAFARIVRATGKALSRIE
jgi:hypothetical protein